MVKTPLTVAKTTILSREERDNRPVRPRVKAMPMKGAAAAKTTWGGDHLEAVLMGVRYYEVEFGCELLEMPQR